MNLDMTAPQPYHRANLRKTLLDAAVALIGEVGPRAFTLREVARRAGVSHNAPYRHFAGKDELLVAVAEEGFDRLTAVMQKTLARGKSPRERLQLCGCGYVSFALRWPQHFLVMFDLPQLCASTARNRVSAKMRFVFCSTALPAHSHCLSEIGVVWGAGHNQRRAKPSAACPLRKGTDKQHHTCLRPNSSKWSIRKALISTIPTQ
jgi:AcrR family transcriptional regulator